MNDKQLKDRVAVLEEYSVELHKYLCAMNMRLKTLEGHGQATLDENSEPPPPPPPPSGGGPGSEENGGGG